MKCKSRTIVILLVGITAGFILSAALQNLLLPNTITSSNVAQPSDRRLTTNIRQLSDKDLPNSVEDTEQISAPKSTDGEVVRHPSSETPTVASNRLESNQINWQTRNMQNLHTGNTLPVGKLSEELALRQPYLIAIITSVNRLMSHTMAIHGTWARKESKNVVYFTGEVQTMPHLPHNMKIIQLQGIDDKQASWDIKEFSVIKYLTSHFTEQIDWFLIISDETFVNTELFSKKLEQYRADVPVYMGQRIKSLDNTNEKKEKCNSMTGVVYSRGLLNRMEPYLPQCEGEEQTISDCIVLRAIHCTQAKETQELFYLDDKRMIETDSLFISKDITHAITVQPIRYPKYMYRVHSYFLEVSYNHSRETAKSSANDIRMTHPFIPTHLRSPYKFESQETQKEELLTKQKVAEALTVTQQLTTTTNTPIRPPHIPKTKFEVNFWEYFNQTRLMSIYHEQPSRGIIGGLREEARYMLTKGIYVANQGRHPKDRLIFEKLENGYHRIDPMRGSEYILDFFFRKSSERSVRIKKRVSLLRPFHEAVIPVPTAPRADRVHFIVTLSGLSNRLEQFLTNFERNILTQKQDASLTIVLFKGPDDEKVSQMVNKYASRYPATAISILETEGEFARGVGLNYGAGKFNGDDLLFFVDVDLEIKTDFIHRCQLNTILGKQVYFPIFFKLYNPEFVNRHYKGNESQLLSRHNGHWAHYSYGMVCIYASDYVHSGGFNINIRGWGEEDIDFLNRVMKHNLNIFRSPDPGLVHMWHRKVCDKSKVVSPRTYLHCLQSKAENLADRTELAQYVFTKELNEGNVL